MSFRKKHVESAFNKARSNLHNIRNINDTDLKRKLKQSFYYLSLLKTTDKIVNEQKALDSLNSIYKTLCLDRSSYGIIGELAELSIEYNFHKICVALMTTLTGQLERALSDSNSDAISTIYVDNFIKILFMVVSILKMLTKNSNKFLFEVFVSLDGIKAVLAILNSDAIIGKFVSQYDLSDLTMFSRILEGLLILLNQVVSESDKQIDWQCHQASNILVGFYKKTGSISDEVRVLTCILVFKVVDSEELLDAINESTATSLKSLLEPPSKNQLATKLTQLISQFISQSESDTDKRTQLSDFECESASTTITEWNLIDLLGALNTLLNISPFLWDPTLDIKLFESFCKHDSLKVQELSMGIVSILSKLDEQKESSTPHIMISYYPNDRDLCNSIKSNLESLGYNVWMEEGRSSKANSNSKTTFNLDKMAKGIEDSLCVLMCVSDMYKECGQCRAEAEYAFNIGKPIVPLIMQKGFKSSGWIGIIMGTKIFVNFTKYEYDECIRRLENELQPLIKQRKKSDSKVMPEVAKVQAPIEKHVDSVGIESSANKDKHAAEKLLKRLLDWSSSDVSAWMCEKSIANEVIKKNLGDGECNGQCLYELYLLKMSAPDFFFGFFEHALKSKTLDLKDLMAFSCELECLFSY